MFLFWGTLLFITGALFDYLAILSYLDIFQNKAQKTG